MKAYLFSLGICLNAVLIAATATQAAFPVRTIPVHGVTDLVREPNANSLLLSVGGGAYRYDLDADQLDLTPRLIDHAQRLDLSPSGSRVVGAANAFSIDAPNLSWVTIHDIVKDTSTTVTFPKASQHEGGPFDAAFIDDDTLLVTTTYNGSGWVPLRRIDLDSGLVTVIGSVRQDTSLEPSADRSAIAFAEGNASNGPFGYYDVASQSLHQSGRAGNHIDEIAPDRIASRFAVPSIGGVEVFDRNFQRLGWLPAAAPQRYPVDVIFSPVSDVLYVSWTGFQVIDNAPKSIVAYNAHTLEVLGTIDETNRFSTNEFRELMISRDGRELYALVRNQFASWINQYDVSQLAVPEPQMGLMSMISILALVRVQRWRWPQDISRSGAGES